MTLYRLSVLLFAFLLRCPLAGAAEAAAGSAQWETEIAAFEQADAAKSPPRGGVLFVGSSSIRLWKTLAQDFPGQQVLNRGYGGSQLQDSVELFHRVVAPYEPGFVVLFAGTNDIANGRTPEQVAESFEAFVTKLQQKFPKTELAFISITSSPARWAQRAKVVEANRMIQAVIQKMSRVKFIPVREKLLGANGAPRKELFADDQLHLNADGYRLLADTVRPFLPKP